MSMEFNKLFAAILVAGIVAMLAGFIADVMTHRAHPAENAFPIEVAESAATGGAVAAAGPEPVDEFMKTADIDKGQKLTKVCAACHTFNAGGANKVGPNLWNVTGRGHGHAKGFTYSDAMQAKALEKWDRDALNHFLWSPKKAVPGTKMVFAGIKKPEDRAAVIKYLESLK